MESKRKMSDETRHRLEGFIGGTLILVFAVFVYGQYRFQTEQKAIKQQLRQLV